MYKQPFLCDSDALIKMAKASFLRIFVQQFYCLLTREVEKEVVTDGKKNFHTDAEEIERLIQEKCLHVSQTQLKEDSVLKKILGSGEVSLYGLHQLFPTAIVVSDDKAFVKTLEEEKIHWITTADCLLLLYEMDLLERIIALEKLERLKSYIHQRQYEKIKNMIGEKK